jgi:hypothetical protein
MSYICKMLVTRVDIQFLKTIATTKDLIAVESIPVAFKQDFNAYFFGKTLIQKDHLLFAYPHDIKDWTHYMFNKYNG